MAHALVEFAKTDSKVLAKLVTVATILTVQITHAEEIHILMENTFAVLRMLHKERGRTGDTTTFVPTNLTGQAVLRMIFVLVTYALPVFAVAAVKASAKHVTGTMTSIVRILPADENLTEMKMRTLFAARQMQRGDRALGPMTTCVPDNP